MISLLWVLAALLCLQGVWQLIKYVVVIRDFRQKSRAPVRETPPRHRFIVLAPVLHEEPTLATFLDDMSRVEYPADLYEVCVVTTEKEFNEGPRPNTIDALIALMQSDRYPSLALSHSHFPFRDGHKADQLQHAFVEFRRERGDNALRSTFLLCLDVDSRVDPDTLRRYEDAIVDGVDIYQRPVLWFKNIHQIENSFTGSFAFLQSFFSVAFEIPMFTGRFVPWRLRHFVGHGLCLRGSYLLQTGGFPPVIEDIRQGRIASFLEKPARVVPGFGLVETAKNYRVFVKQSSVWYFGFGLFFSDYWRARKLRGVDSVTLRDALLLTYGIFKGLRWLLKGPLHLLGLVGSLWLGDAVLALTFVTALALNSLVPTALAAWDFRAEWSRRMSRERAFSVLLKSIVFSPIAYVMAFPGPVMGLFKLAEFYRCGKISLPKTER